MKKMNMTVSKSGGKKVQDKEKYCPHIRCTVVKRSASIGIF